MTTIIIVTIIIIIIRFKQLVLALHSSQEKLQTIITTHVALSVLDIQSIVNNMDNRAIINDCDVILGHHYSSYCY